MESKKKKNLSEKFSAFFFFFLIINAIWRASQVVQVVKNLPAIAGDMRCRFDPWVRNILAWRIPWIKEPGRLQFIGLQRVRHNLACNAIWKKEGKSSIDYVQGES